MFNLKTNRTKFWWIKYYVFQNIVNIVILKKYSWSDQNYEKFCKMVDYLFIFLSINTHGTCIVDSVELRSMEYWLENWFVITE